MAEEALVKREEIVPHQKQTRELMKSRLFNHVGSEANGLAMVTQGAEMGVGAVTALNNMAVIGGKICMSGQLLLALAMQRGVTWKVTKESATESEVVFTRGQMSYTATFTLAEAQKAKLIKKDGAWETWTTDMLYWRAVGRGLRRIAPDVTLGVYVKEEMESGGIIETEVIPTPTGKPLLESDKGTNETQGPTTGTPVPTGEGLKPGEKKEEKKELTQEEMVDAFYSIMAEQCKRIGVEKYEAWIKGHGLENLKKVTTREEMKKLYLSIRAVK